MNDTIIENGDYVYDGAGGFVRAGGADALLRRCLLKLQARRGGFVFVPDYGSALGALVGTRAADRAAAARAAAAEALSGEPVSVHSAELVPLDDGATRIEFVIGLDDGGDRRLSITTTL